MVKAEELEIKIRVFKDGDEWCSLIGEDLQSGIAGFDKSPSESLRELFLYLANFPSRETLAEELNKHIK